MERSYEIAANYVPQMQNQGEANNSLKSKIENYPNKSSNSKTIVSSVRQIQKSIVSSLARNISDEELYQM